MVPSEGGDEMKVDINRLKYAMHYNSGRCQEKNK